MAVMCPLHYSRDKAGIDDSPDVRLVALWTVTVRAWSASLYCRLRSSLGPIISELSVWSVPSKSADPTSTSVIITQLKG